jgi:hypothetical protein
MILIIFGVCWGRILEATWNFEQLFAVTWRTTSRKSVCKLYKSQTKSENHETCLGVMLWHVEVVCKNWLDFEQVGTLDASNPDISTHDQVWYHVWKCLGLRHPTSQLARNLLNCCIQPLHATTWPLDKFHDFRTSFGFYIIYKHFSCQLFLMLRQKDVRIFMWLPRYSLNIHQV